jgi:hypothetical protein
MAVKLAASWSEAPAFPCAALVAAALVWPSAACAEWRLEAFTGTAHNFTTPLTLRQTDRPELRLDARYETRPFTGSPYDAARLGWWSGASGWELQVLHHKLYLANPSPEFSHLEISHGYNMITLGRAGLWRGFTWRGALGLVVTFPETTVRGRKRPVLGYDLSGFTAAAGLGRRWPQDARLSLVGEARLTLSWVTIPVFEGEADVPNRALHLLVGLGYRF